MTTPWRPRLAKGDEPIYARLHQAMEADIAAGKLGPGARLPSQREVAHLLSISVGAVTRAYDELARRGRIESHVGRGSFVTGAGADDQGGVIDLAANTPPLGPAQSALAATLAETAERKRLSGGLGYAPPGGGELDRRAGAKWLAMTSGEDAPDWRRLLCVSGAQSGLAVSLTVLTKPRDVVLCEAATYAAIKPLVRQMGATLRGVALDEEGMRPDALAKAAQSAGARTLYVTPTLHNPTARTMSEKRRKEIVRVARKHDLTIIEDNVYAMYAADAPPTLSALAPERTFHVTSLSKSVAPGLRVGYLVAPDAARFEQAVQCAFAQTVSASSLGLAVATSWIEQGAALEIVKANVAEAAARVATAKAALGAHLDAPGATASLHVWAPMTLPEADRVHQRLMQAGVQLTAPRAHEVAPESAPTGLRVCIGAATTRAALAKGLTALAAAIERRATPLDESVI
jgi:DNA-binding transcriptional MocR family regulator